MKFVRKGLGEEFAIDRGPAAARLLTDRDGIVRDANIDACIMLDMGRRALIGKRISTFVDRADTAQLNQLLSRLSSAHRSEVQLRLRDRVGRLRTVQIEGSAPKAGQHILWKARPIILAA